MSDSKAAFLGPQAENHALLEGLVLEVLRDHVYWRRSFHPEDPSSIRQTDMHTATYLETAAKLRQELFTILGELKKGVPFASLRYLGHINNDLFLSAVVGYFGAMLYNQNNVVAESSPVTVSKELSYIAALAKMLGFPRMDKELLKSDPAKSSWGHLTSGGTVANIEALWTARNVKFYPLGIGLFLRRQRTLGLTGEYGELEGLEIADGRGRRGRIIELSAFELLSFSPQVALDIRHGIRSLLVKARGWNDGEEAFRSLEKSLRRLQTLGVISFIEECKKEGLSFKPPVVMIPRSMHYSWPKTMDVLGLGRDKDILIEIDLDSQFRTKKEHLQDELVKRFSDQIPVLSVIGVCGSTEEGAIDPLHSMVDVRKELWTKNGFSFWIHSDAAYGGFFASVLRSETRDTSDLEKQYAGIAALKSADSVTIDPHKLGFVPYPAGAVLFQDARAREHITFEAPYLNDDEDVTRAFLGKWTLEGSRPGAAAISCYIAQHCFPLNDQGHGALLRDCLRATRLILNAFDSVNGDSDRNRGFKIHRLYEPELNVVCYNVVSEKYIHTPDSLNKLTKMVFDRLTVTGLYHVSHYDFIVSKTDYPLEKYDDQIKTYLKKIRIQPSFSDPDRFSLVALRTVMMHSLAKESEEHFDRFAEHLCRVASEVLPALQIELLKERFKTRGENRRLKILIVEDERDDRDSLKYHLEMEYPVSAGLDINGASKEADAISLISTFKPDAMIVDLDLTGSKGGEFLGLNVIKAAKREKGIAVVAYTAYGENPIVGEMLKDLGVVEDCIVSKERLDLGEKLEGVRKEESQKVLNAILLLL
jgi:glutamate/tyrosine decarboxylase-like PLP-dependent enzyme